MRVALALILVVIACGVKAPPRPPVKANEANSSSPSPSSPPSISPGGRPRDE